MTSEPFLDELSANLIENSKYQEFPEGTLGAIQYLSKQHLSKLKGNIEKDILQTEMVSMRAAEDTIIKGFHDFLSDGGVRILLTKKEKTENIDFLIEPISYLYTLRNKYNPEELKKLGILQSKKDTSWYFLSIDFKRKPKTESYFIRNIQIRKIQ